MLKHIKFAIYTLHKRFKPSICFLAALLFSLLATAQKLPAEKEIGVDSLYKLILAQPADSLIVRENYYHCHQIFFLIRDSYVAKETIPYAKQILKLAKNSENTLWINQSKLALVYAYTNARIPQKAVLLANELLPVFQKQNELKFLTEILFLKGFLAREASDFEAMSNYFQQALDLARKNNFHVLNYEIASFWGGDFKLVGEFDKSIALYKEGLSQPGLSPEKLVRGLSDLGSAFLTLQKFDSTDHYFKKAEKLAVDNNLTEELTSIRFNKACLDFDQGKINESEKSTLALLPLITKLDRADWRSETYGLLMDIYKEKKDFEKALMYAEMHYKAEDTAFFDRSSKELQSLDRQLKTAEKDKTILMQQAQLDEEIRNRQRTLLVVAVILVILLLAVFIIWTNRKRRESKMKQEMAESEMKALRAQMNPHFMFNSLNAIQQMVLNQETDEAFRYLDIYSKLTRQILENSEKKWISVKEEIRFLELYLKMESLRFDYGFQYQIEVDEEVMPNTDKLPSMVVQPIVENALKHGLLQKEGEKQLKIQFSKSADSEAIVVHVEDNGIGRTAAAKGKQVSHHSMSTDITQNRLKLLGKGQGGQMEITDLQNSADKPTGTRVSLIIPQPEIVVNS